MPLVVLTNPFFPRHYFKLKVPTNDCCFRGFSVVVIFVCVCWLHCRQLDSSRLFWPHSKITASYCCHTAALSSIFPAVTTVLCLPPTAVVPLSINSSPQGVLDVQTCVFIPGYVWSCAYLVWVQWRIDRARLKWQALRCDKSKWQGAYHGSTAFCRSPLIGYYQDTDCYDGK